MSNSHFDEKSGIVCHETEFGKWYQSVAEVTVLVNLELGTRGKEVHVDIQPNKLKCEVRGKLLFEGKSFGTILVDESTWTIEDKKLLTIQLVKADERTKDQCWLSLLENQFIPDAFVLNEMRKKLDLERFQLENPGFDFSGAKLDKQYEEKGVQQMENAINSLKS